MTATLDEIPANVIMETLSNIPNVDIPESVGMVDGNGTSCQQPVPGDLSSIILRLVMYFDVFRHPLTLSEVVRFIDSSQPAIIVDEVKHLVHMGTLEQRENFVFRPGMDDSIHRRRVRSRNAEGVWPRARRAAEWLYRIPQVRGLLVTGSLSKNSTQAQDDVDFMVLVEPGQVWTLKTILQGIRRTLPESIRECFCTNYLLDISRPRIDDRNMFTAIELATAMPMAGRSAIVHLLEANRDWASHYVPGFEWTIERARNLRPDSQARPRLPTSTWLERQAMALWSRYWDRKYHWLDPEVRENRFKRRPEIATNHLHDFQGYVLNEVRHRLAPLGVELTSSSG